MLLVEKGPLTQYLAVVLITGYNMSVDKAAVDFNYYATSIDIVVSIVDKQNGPLYLEGRQRGWGGATTLTRNGNTSKKRFFFSKTGGPAAEIAADDPDLIEL